MQPPVFEHLRRLPRPSDLTAGQPAPPLGQLVRLDENINPYGPAEAVRASVALAATAPGLDWLGRYPEAEGLALKQAIAASAGCGPDQVILGNGSCELLTLAARAMLIDGGSGVAARHSFAPFGLATLAAGGRSVECHASADEVEVGTLLAAVQPDTRIVYLGHPNNPTGALLAPDDLARLARSLREDVLLVVDQAYAEYQDPADYPDAAAFLGERIHLLVLRTFSKIHGLAGLRLGYGLGSPGLIDLLERVRSPFHPGHLAQVAATAALAATDHTAACRSRNREARIVFRAEAERHPCRVSGRAGNFLLLETIFPAQELTRDLLRRGIQVAPMNGYGLPNHIRVAMGTPEAMRAFWAAAAPILDHLGCGCP